MPPLKTCKCVHFITKDQSADERKPQIKELMTGNFKGLEKLWHCTVEKISEGAFVLH